MLGLIGFGLGCIALYFAAEPLGPWIALALLAAIIGWSLPVLYARLKA